MDRIPAFQASSFMRDGFRMTRAELADVLITSACMVLIILSLAFIPGGR